MRLCVGPFSEDDIDLAVLHRRVEDLLDVPSEAMNLVNEEDVTWVEIRENGGQIPSLLDGRTGADSDPDTHLGCDNLGERRLAESGRTAEEYVIERLSPPLGRRDVDPEFLLDLRLADELVNRSGAQRPEGGILLGLDPGDSLRPHLAGHSTISARPASTPRAARCPSGGYHRSGEGHGHDSRHHRHVRRSS